MTILKTVKSRAYFKRYQTRFYRRSEGKTDFQARHHSVWQDRNKYDSRKYRMIVKLSNKDITCQIVYAEGNGDKVFCSAYSHELPRYGLNAGLNNYSAAYATGLLIARRTLQKLGMDDKYKGAIEADDLSVETEADDEQRPFTVSLDIGLKITTTGANVFGAMKGAVDGGFNIPHNEKRFPGNNKTNGEYNSDKHRDRIFGKHVIEYMQMIEDDQPQYNQKFGQYIKHGIAADNLEEIIKGTHEAIRADPSAQDKKAKYNGEKYANDKKMNLKQKKDRIRQIKETHLNKLRS